MMLILICLTNLVTCLLTFYVDTMILAKIYFIAVICCAIYYLKKYVDQRNKYYFDQFKSVYSNDHNVKIPSQVLNECNSLEEFRKLLNEYHCDGRIKKYLGQDVKNIYMPKNYKCYMHSRKKLLLQFVKKIESSKLYEKMKKAIESNFFEKYALEASKIKKKIKPQFKNIYNNKNIGSYYVSIDIKEGNFTAWFLFFKMLVNLKLDCLTWDDFTDHSMKSKTFRQNVIGVIGKKDGLVQKIQSCTRILMRYIVSDIANNILEHKDEFNFVCLSEDEIVLRIKNEKFNYNEIIKKINTQIEKSNKQLYDLDRFHVNIFKLVGAQPGYIKEYVNEKMKINKLEIKGMSIDKKMQAFCKYCKKNT